MNPIKPSNCLHIEDQDTGVGEVSTRFLMYMSKFQCICKTNNLGQDQLYNVLCRWFIETNLFHNNSKKPQKIWEQIFFLCKLKESKDNASCLYLWWVGVLIMFLKCLTFARCVKFDRHKYKIMSNNKPKECLNNCFIISNWIIPAPPSSSSGQGDPTHTRGLSHAETCLAASDSPHSYKANKKMGWFPDCIHSQVFCVLIFFILTLLPCQDTVDNQQPSSCTSSLQQQSPPGSSDMDPVECPLRNQRLKHQHL